MLMPCSLEQIYKELDFTSGELFSAMYAPNKITQKVWVEKGEWLAAAKRAGADSVFFVENNPVVVFAQSGEDDVEKIKTFNRIWSLSRPRLLILACPGEITVYDLAQQPINLSVDENERKKLNTLAILTNIHSIAKELQDFHRDNIESGKVFEQNRFGDLKNRADKSLIRDLKIVRRELMASGLDGNKTKYAHALIGRSIFIRYLEDRGVLTKEFFSKVARKNAGWTNMLKSQGKYGKFDFGERESLYARILSNKEFTYALFQTLANDFNGDMFPNVDQEKKVVKQKHLSLLQGLLYGNVEEQKKLFFYSYQFDIVPLDLISSIYEEFYHSPTDKDEKKGKARQDGAFYTPSVLAEFVLSRLLTTKELQKKPRVLDPACGSGIFLVEAFRRMARYRRVKKKEPLSFEELKEILKTQIAGIEINEEAARITVFSLCISMLHYLEPPSIQDQIRQGNQLPNLLASTNRSQNYYHCILVGNAFDDSMMEEHPLWAQRFGNNMIDVIVGNPPWGAVDKAREPVMMEWCQTNNKHVGDKEQSQAFILRASDFLKTGGKAGLLVSSGVLLKNSVTTRAFRQEWLANVKLREVFNFTHVRKFFFKGAISPFVSIHFEKGQQSDSPVLYASSKQTVILDKTQAVLFSKADCSWIVKQDLVSSKLWKTYWWGRKRDDEFLNTLKLKPMFQEYLNEKCCGVGIQVASGGQNLSHLSNLKLMPSKLFSRYEPITQKELVELPESVYRKGNEAIFYGKRILVAAGIPQKGSASGKIVAQFAENNFVVQELYGFKLKKEFEWGYEVILGILWSSLMSYYLFMTSTQWGTWHHKIFKDEFLEVPIILERKNAATKKIIAIVKELRKYHPQKQDVLHPQGVPTQEIETTRRGYEQKLDEAIFELYGLSEGQKDLIRDCCDITLPFLYKPFDGLGTQLAVQHNDLAWLENYVNTFSRCWNPYLDDNDEMCARLYVGAHENMIAVKFYPANKKSDKGLQLDTKSWGGILAQIGSSLPHPMGSSRIVLDGLVYIVSTSGLIIIKRNEKRFWTRSLAREDADTTLAKAMLKGMSQDAEK